MGFWRFPPPTKSRLLEAASFMDANECNTVIAAARHVDDSDPRLLERLAQAGQQFRAAAKKKFNATGEW
jgi:4-hydroxy-4-methyl-2-oxoglutarate aldolase